MASAPEFTNIVCFGSGPGTSAFRRSASSTYGSLIVTCMHVWVNRSSCARTASTTAGAELPTFSTARPAPRSISWLPSTSWMIAPEAAWVKIGAVEAMPLGTAAFRRSNSSRERGPGISVTMRRSCARSIPYLPVRGAPARRTQSMREMMTPGRPRVSVSAVAGMRQGPAETPAGALLYAPAQPAPGRSRARPSCPALPISGERGASRVSCTNRTMTDMPLTVGDLLKTPGLPLKAVAGQKGLDHVIRWVHVSELDDPTPWLKGGELLLVTGMGIGTTPARQRAYVNRLVQTGLAGLGFGLGFSHQRVPKALLDAAEAAKFPVFEVPYVLPFIAITEAVFTRLVAEQYDLLSRSLEAEHTLTRAVLEGQGPEGVVSSLTSVVGGWAILLDLHGAVVSATPAAAKSYAKRIWGELQVVPARGHPLQPLARGPRPEHRGPARLVAGPGRGVPGASARRRRSPSSTASCRATRSACWRSSWRRCGRSPRPSDGSAATRSSRSCPAKLSAGETRRLLERLGFDLARPIAAVACSSADTADELAEACEEALTRRTEAFLCSARDGVVVVVLQPDGDERFLSAFRSAVAERARGELMAGAGSLVPHGQLPQTVREARYALQVCQTEGRPEAEFRDLGTYQLLLSLQDPAGARDLRLERPRPARRVRRGARRPPDPVAPGVPGAQRPLGGGRRRAVRAPAHAPLPDAQGRGADRPRPHVARATGWSCSWPCGRATCWRRRTERTGADAVLAPPYKPNGALAPSGTRRGRRKG